MVTQSLVCHRCLCSSHGDERVFFRVEKCGDSSLSAIDNVVNISRF